MVWRRRRSTNADADNVHYVRSEIGYPHDGFRNRVADAFAVEEQLGLHRGGRGVQPAVAALAAQPGFIEVHHGGGLQAGGDLREEFGEIGGGATGHGRDGASERGMPKNSLMAWAVRF